MASTSCKPVKMPWPVGIPDDSKVHRYLAETAVFIFHDENGLAGIRDILAVLFMSTRLRQVHFEMCTVIADPDDAQVVLRRHAAMSQRFPRRKSRADCEQAEQQRSIHAPYFNQAVRPPNTRENPKLRSNEIPLPRVFRVKIRGRKGYVLMSTSEIKISVLFVCMGNIRTWLR